MSVWQLKYVNAAGSTVTVSLAALATSEGGKVASDAWSAQFISHKASKVMMRLPGVPPQTVAQIPFKSRIAILDPSGNTQFAGYRTDRTGTADARKTFSGYTFEDEWFFLDHCPYQQMWLNGTNIIPYSSVVLFQPNPGQTYSPAAVNGVISTGQQIVDILNWAIYRGANLQIGQIDPDLYQAWYPIQNVKCGDAIRHCLRLHPDCFTEIDYTTTPPTFNIRQRSNLTAVTLPYAYTDSSGRRHTATDIQPRPELQPARVALFYRVVSSGMVLSTPVDIYPNSNLSVTGPVVQGQDVGGSSAPYTAGGTPVVGTATTSITGTGTETIEVGAPGGFFALDFSLDLSGPKITASSAAITTSAFDPTSLAWWQNKIPSLTQGIPASGAGALAIPDTSINTGSPTGISVTLDGSPSTYVDLSTYAYELLPKSAPMSWLTASGGGSLEIVEAVVTAHFTYTKQKNVGGSTIVPLAKPNDHPHHVRVKLCNSASISETYRQYVTTGEAVPANLAENIYNSLATLQYNLTHTIVERPFNGWIKPGKHAINLGGSEAATAWATMNATPQTVDYKLHVDGNGNTYDNFTVKCGPVEHLEPGQLVQLFNVFANRDLTKIDTNERITGAPASGNTVLMPADTAQENSIPAVPDQGLQTFNAPDPITSGSTNTWTHDPASQTVGFTQYNSSGSSQAQANLPRIWIGTGAPSSTTLKSTIQYALYGEVYFDVTVATAPVMYIPTTAGNNTTSVWAKVAGGGTGQWQSPRELNPTVAVAQYTWVYISPGNPLVTPGLVDLVSGSLTMARPGIWQALQAIPAKVTVSGVTKYNVPQVPYPTSGGTGDLDASNVYWALLSATPYC